MPGAGRPLLSHGAACTINAGDENAEIEIMLYFVDRAPVGPYRIIVAARRTIHLRFNELTAPWPHLLASAEVARVEAGCGLEHP